MISYRLHILLEDTLDQKAGDLLGSAPELPEEQKLDFMNGERLVRVDGRVYEKCIDKNFENSNPALRLLVYREKSTS